MVKKRTHISSQAVGAYGEKIVEAELLRRGWIPSNVNASVKNAVDYDIIAQRENGHRIVTLRVKTCSPEMGAFQFGFRKSEQIIPKNIAGNDFTVLVQMGETREHDRFFIIPTQRAREDVLKHRNASLERRGGKPTNFEHWTLHLKELRSGVDQPNYGFERKWKNYLGNWESLEFDEAKTKTQGDKFTRNEGDIEILDRGTGKPLFP